LDIVFISSDMAFISLDIVIISLDTGFISQLVKPLKGAPGEGFRRIFLLFYSNMKYIQNEVYF